MCHLTVFGFYPCEISVNFTFEIQLTLFLTVVRRKVIVAVIHVHDLGYHVIGFLCYGAFSGFRSDRLYEFSKRSAAMRLIRVLR